MLLNYNYLGTEGVQYSITVQKTKSRCSEINTFRVTAKQIPRLAARRGPETKRMAWGASLDSARFL